MIYLHPNSIITFGAADPSAAAHRRISLKSSTASSLTVRTSPTFAPAQASKLRRVGAGDQAWPRVLARVFHADAPNTTTLPGI
jgi:hypothetical protein